MQGLHPCGQPCITISPIIRSPPVEVHVLATDGLRMSDNILERLPVQIDLLIKSKILPVNCKHLHLLSLSLKPPDSLCRNSNFSIFICLLLFCGDTFHVAGNVSAKYKHLMSRQVVKIVNYPPAGWKTLHLQMSERLSASQSNSEAVTSVSLQAHKRLFFLFSHDLPEKTSQVTF